MSKPFVISRLLNAPQSLVWEVYTKPEHMTQWFGPKGSTMSYCKLDFRVGGINHYCMHFNGMEMWGKFQYKEITPIERVVHIQCFSDEKGGVSKHPMSPDWPTYTHSTMTLTEQGDKTLFTITWLPHEATAEEIAVFDASHESMNQGWGGNLDVLEDYLASLSKKA